MPQSNTSDATQDNYCIPCGDVFFLRINDEVFGDDVFFLGIKISDTCGFSSAKDRSAGMLREKE